MTELYWDADAVAVLMLENGIKTRGDLYRVLRPDVSRMTVFRAFTEEWKGRVSSIPLYVAIAERFSVSLADLVVEPVAARQNAEQPTIDRGIR